MNEYVGMPTCNFSETRQNKWLLQSKNKITCLIEAIYDLVHVFIHIATYMSWLRGGCNGKGYDSASLQLKVVAKCGYLKLLADATSDSQGRKISTLMIVF